MHKVACARQGENQMTNGTWPRQDRPQTCLQDDENADKASGKKR